MNEKQFLALETWVRAIANTSSVEAEHSEFSMEYEIAKFEVETDAEEEVRKLFITKYHDRNEDPF